MQTIPDNGNSIIGLLDIEGEDTGIGTVEGLLNDKGYQTQTYVIKDKQDITDAAEQFHSVTFFSDQFDRDLIHTYSLWGSLGKPLKLVVGVMDTFDWSEPMKLVRPIATNGYGAESVMILTTDERTKEEESLSVSELYDVRINAALEAVFKSLLYWDKTVQNPTDFAYSHGFLFHTESPENPNLQLYCTRHHVLETPGSNASVPNLDEKATYWHSKNHGIEWRTQKEVIDSLIAVYEELGIERVPTSFRSSRSCLVENSSHVCDSVQLTGKHRNYGLTVAIGYSGFKSGVIESNFPIIEQLEIMRGHNGN